MLNMFHFLEYLPHLLSPLSVQAVVAELQLSGLVTEEESKKLSDLNEVVRVQSGKPPTKMVKTAEILKKHGLVRESKYLEGNQTRPAFVL